MTKSIGRPTQYAGADGSRRVELRPGLHPGLHRAAQWMSEVTPIEVVTDAAMYPAVLNELIPSAWHHFERCANGPIEADHGRLKHRL